MGLFTKNKKIETGLVRLHGLLTNSFQNVQKDTSYILGWLNYLYHKNLQQEQLIKQLQEQLDYVPKSKEEIRKIVDEYYSYEHILSRIKELDERLENLRKSHLELHKNQQELHQAKHEIEPKIQSLRSEILAQKPILSQHARSFEHISNRIEELDTTVEGLRKSHLELHKNTQELHKKHEELHPKIEALKTQIAAQKPTISQKIPTAEIDELSRRLEKLETKKATNKKFKRLHQIHHPFIHQKVQQNHSFAAKRNDCRRARPVLKILILSSIRRD